ncbi:MAG: response regulator transcription factor [bacterium]
MISKIKLLIADDQSLCREGLVSLFSKEPGIEVVGEAKDGVEAIELAAGLSPDVVIVTALLDKLDGVSVTIRVNKLPTCPQVIFLSHIHNETQIRDAFEAGAKAFLLKSCDFKELSFAVTKVARGDFYLTGPAGQELVTDYVKHAVDSRKPGGVMTQRERQLAKLLADGYSTKEAAEFMNISPKTAETHRASIMKKLGAKNVTDIVKYCIRNCLLEP